MLPGAAVVLAVLAGISAPASCFPAALSPWAPLSLESLPGAGSRGHSDTSNKWTPLQEEQQVTPRCSSV